MIAQKKLSKDKRKPSDLQTFKNTCTISQIFVQARQYPPFFNENLVDEDRTIKIFQDQPYAHETIFYFQLLKLIFETEGTDYQKYLGKIYDLLDDSRFQFVVADEESYYGLQLGEGRMRRMLEQFLEELGEGNIGVTQIIAKYPVIDKIMVLFMRSILIAAAKCESFDQYLQPVQIYEFLADYFQVEITYFTNCLKFNQTDLFVYFQAENEIYLAYISPRTTSQQIPSSNELYHHDPSEAFNISSVKQMVSEIDLPLEEECFSLSKQNQSGNETEFFQYDYSQTQDCRYQSKSIQENSDLKFSYLINDENCVLQSITAIKSNKVLEKELPVQKKHNFGKAGWKNIDCFEIKEAPLELQNAVSPAATPKSARFASFAIESAFKKQHRNIYQKRSKNTSNVQDTIKQECDLVSTGESYAFGQAKLRQQENTWEAFRKETERVLGNEEEECYKPPQKTLKSLYQMRSIKSIVSCNDSQSYVLDNPLKASFNQSRKETTQGLSMIKKNEYTRHGYINNNISSEFTNSVILKELQNPFKSKIESIKLRARSQRRNIQNMMCF